MVVRGFKYRCYPTPDQQVALARTFGCCRYVYNWALRLRTDAWFGQQRRVNYAQSSASLTELKRQPEVEWLNDVSSVPVQQSLRHLQGAFVNFWEKRAAYPSFKSKHARQSAEFTRSAFSWDGERLTLAKIGALKIKRSRQFTGDPSTVRISKTSAGRYFVAFQVDEPLPTMPRVDKAIGVDVGLTVFAAASDGSKFTAPRPLRRKMAQLKRAQQMLSRKQKGSKNRNKARIRVAKIHQKIYDIRNDFLHKLSTRLVRENQTIATEDLNVRGMLANHRLAQGIGDSGWSEFFRQLAYKCEWYDRTLVKIDRFYPSSKRCSQCGHIVEAMPLDVRTWTCPECGAIHDRDVNAARNILAAGQAVIACGDGVKPPRSQERRGIRPRSRNRSKVRV